jgi:endo-1,4-beta-xylanase
MEALYRRQSFILLSNLKAGYCQISEKFTIFLVWKRPMVNSRLLSRRNVLQLVRGAAASVGCLALAKFVHNLYQFQALNDPSRNFTIARLERSLKQLAISKNLIYGAASGYKILSTDSEFAVRFTEECNILVPENDLKWETLRPTPEQFDFTAADWLINYTQAHNLKIRGTPLIWHLQLPFWFKKIVNRQNAERFLVNHIETVAGRYAGKMHSWDVVNEAIETSDHRPDGLRNTPWLEFLGEEYIDLAFRTAAKADPSSLLVYNDIGLEYDTPYHQAKRVAVLKLLERLKAKGTPIGAFGIQSHLKSHETRFNPKKLRRFLSDIASLGLKILVTELDVEEKELPADKTLRDRIVAAAYEDYLNVVLDEPTVIAVITWGLSDRYTWLSEFAPRSDKLPVRPLPLDANFKRKLAWNAIARAFDNAPVRSISRT